MRKKRYVRTIVLLGLIAATVYLAVRFYPVWKAAEYVQENLDLAHYSYELEVELDQALLQETQGKLLKILTGLTGLEEEDICHLTLRGNVWEDRIHVLIYPGDSHSPFIELYLASDTDVVNETLLYNTIRNHLAEKVKLLDFVMPEQSDTLYMTLEQAEQIFGIDLKSVRNFSLQTINDKPVTIQYFLMMAAMSRKKEEDWSRFAMETEQLELQLEVPEENSAAALKLRLDIQNPAELVEKEARLFSWMGLPVSGEQLEMVERLSIVMTPGGQEITMPTDLVNQKIVELISGIREWIIKLGGGNAGGVDVL